MGSVGGTWYSSVDESMYTVTTFIEYLVKYMVIFCVVDTHSPVVGIDHMSSSISISCTCIQKSLGSARALT